MRTESNSNSRTYNSVRNITFGFLNKLVTIMLTFVSRRVFIQVLSINYLGISSLFTDILTMLSLADMGFGIAMSYSFYKPLAERNEKKLAALLGYYKKVYIGIALLVTGIGLSLLPFLELIVNLENSIPYLRWYYLFYLFNVVVSYLFAYKACIISADQKSHIVSRYGVWIALLKTGIQMILLYATHSYMSYLFMEVAATITNNLLISYKADSQYPYIKNKCSLKAEEKKEIFKNMKSVFIYKFATVVMGGTDNIIISILVGTAAVGLYSNYCTITTNFLGAVITILFSSLTASIGNLIVKDSPEKRYEVFKTMQMISNVLSGIFIVCLYFLTDDFITLWLGSQYLLDKKTLIVILMNFYLTITFNPIWSFRDASGLYQKVKYVLLATAIVNLILSLILGRYYGIAGVIGATCIARLTTYFWYEPALLFKSYFNQRVSAYYISHLANICFILLSIGILGIILPKKGEVTIFNWLIKAVICGVVVCFLYGLRYIKSNEGRMLLGKIGHIFHARKEIV